jgi:hypothetical protein
MKDKIVEARDCCKGQGQHEKQDEEGNCQNYARWEGRVYDNADCEGYKCSINKVRQ